MRVRRIVRRVDDLGRIIIPREVRLTLNIREGDPLEVFVGNDGSITFKKFSPLNEEEENKKE
ncbi:MAG: AbrB/MazE/SpoVT family DNA-binding domain-containing protein [Candidatus Riflebacteria bacterium]|nr:AbrB/MazE/SpoVT family DNA-binding domain-containing protein [Candidatus Riflebacteria bacterium]